MNFGTRFRRAAGVILAAGGIAGVGTVHTQDVEPPPEDRLIVRQQADQILSSDVVGANVINLEHGVIGKIDKLLFDRDDQIVGAVVAFGGFLGFGAKAVALSWDAFEFRPDSRAAHISLSPEQLEAAPAFRERRTAARGAGRESDTAGAAAQSD